VYGGGAGSGDVAAASCGGNIMLTVMDFYCGAGGSSSGAELVPGVRVRYAINHWDLAIEVHNTNMPHVDHDVIDVTQADPRRYPSTDIGWFSPECTSWSVARGQTVDYAHQPGLFDDPLPPEAVQRSRVQMEDVPRFTAYHRY
jgi:DNA (cytosine-5)-methyltransferase 1